MDITYLSPVWKTKALKSVRFRIRKLFDKNKTTSKFYWVKGLGIGRPDWNTNAFLINTNCLFFCIFSVSLRKELLRNFLEKSLNREYITRVHDGISHRISDISVARNTIRKIILVIYTAQMGLGKENSMNNKQNYFENSQHERRMRKFQKHNSKFGWKMWVIHTKKKNFTSTTAGSDITLWFLNCFHEEFMSSTFLHMILPILNGE
jgi:hypothetical protein